MKKKTKLQVTPKINDDVNLVWLKASYHFHTYAYRDPRSVFASAVGIPVVSPTTIKLGVISSLFRLGLKEGAENFAKELKNIKVIIDSPNGIIFFKAFHQLRRYESSKWDEPKKGKVNFRVGLTNINQGTREYGLMDGEMAIYVGVPFQMKETVKEALVNITHLGTHDSLCSLVGNVNEASPTEDIIFIESTKFPKERILNYLNEQKSVVMVTLSDFEDGISPEPVLNYEQQGYWWMSGGKDTVKKTFVIPGKFEGTTRGKIYRKHI